MQNHKWDLLKILKNTTLEEKTNKLFSSQSKIIEIINNDLFLSEDNLFEFHKEELKYIVLKNQISNFLSNNMNVDLANNKWFFLSQKIEKKSINFSQKIISLEEKIIKNKTKIFKFLKHEKIKKYQKYYDDIFKYEKYKLDSKIEKFCATYTQLNSSYYFLFNILFDQEIEIKDALDSSKKKHKIENYSKFLSLMTNKDRTLRKNTFINWTNAIHKHRESFSRLLYYNFAELNINSKNKNYKDGYFESALYSDDVNLEFLLNIYKNFKKYKDIFTEYRKIKQKILKINYSLKKIELWDLHIDLFNKDEHFEIEDAKKIILESLTILGDEYISYVKKAFNNNSIDWLPKKNKISGAYCISGCFGIENKYILLNYNYKFDDVITLAHELGHAIHATIFSKHQDIYAETTIFLAEIPSIFNELLVNYYFLNKYKQENNLEKLLIIYDNLISSFINTTSSQLLFSEWEYKANQLILNDSLFDANTLEELYQTIKLEYFEELNQKKSTLITKSLSKILTVPHFYAGNCYVYKYSVGKMIAVFLIENIYEQKNKKIINKYLDFLKLGVSLKNLDSIKILGINFSEKEIWITVNKVVLNWIKNYKNLYNQIYKNAKK